MHAIVSWRADAVVVDSGALLTAHALCIPLSCLFLHFENFIFLSSDCYLLDIIFLTHGELFCSNIFFLTDNLHFPLCHIFTSPDEVSLPQNFSHSSEDIRFSLGCWSLLWDCLTTFLLSSGGLRGYTSSTIDTRVVKASPGELAPCSCVLLKVISITGSLFTSPHFIQNSLSLT